ncbi:SDR family NAD(P)-dependent oxidoreductase [Candidatus Pelagibacter sp. HIMB1521]|uniref:SDR family NAD(P)-dependent oxidoreductase n=1 Tax=Candidatus Pelagibacter sp. HIMB1521 TaxID=3413344 RepID=UPI003F8280FB
MINNSIIFKKNHLNSFTEFSSDKNPLHVNSEYASLTPFSENVVYGVSGVFFLLSKINLKENIIASIKIDFKKPLFLNKKYYFTIGQDKHEIRLKLFKGNTIYTKVKIKNNYKKKLLSKFKLAPSINKEITSKKYKWNKIPTKKNLKKLLVSYPGLENIPFWLLQILAWSSYWVGMICPGRQALFSSFNFELNGNSLTFKYEKNLLHRILKQNKSFFSSSDGSKILLLSFVRPKPISQLKSVIFKNNNKKLLKNKRCFVTGGTRGVGSVFSQMLSSHGAEVFASYRRNKKTAEKIEKFISSKGEFFKALNVNQFNKNVFNKKIDCLVLNAAPTIKHIDLHEMSKQEFDNEKKIFYNLTVSEIKFFRKNLSKDATIINVSTSFIDEKPDGFSHYFKGKKAVENYLKDFSSKNLNYTLLNFRLPKMHTDQTNTTFIDNQIYSPIKIIKKVMDLYLSFRGKKGFHSFNII